MFNPHRLFLLHKIYFFRQKQFQTDVIKNEFEKILLNKTRYLRQKVIVSKTQ